MLKSRIMKDDTPERRVPDLFVAARDNNVSHLKEALEAGRRLDAVDGFNGFTPLHVAAYNGSLDFIREALKHSSANVWIRDLEERLPIDHADARSDRDAARLFYEAMYSRGVPLQPLPDPA
jgi:ankyrin repeat protein